LNTRETDSRGTMHRQESPRARQMRQLHQGPLWRRERIQRAADAERYHVQGNAQPHLRTIALVELDAINVPEWARRKAIKGLTLTADSVWLGRIAANALAELDRQAGGSPKMTKSVYRRCKICKKPLLGPEAESRLDADRKVWGDGIPCGPDCLELMRAKKGQLYT
jgi:hypothetical protein